MTDKREKEWFDDEDFWRELYPFLFSDKRFKHTAESLEKILELIKPLNPSGKKVLDLCCGPGRFAVGLAKAGYQVTGVDKTRFLLEKARTMAEEAGVDIEWAEADMRDFIRPESFDIVLSTFTSFGYFDDKKEDLRTLENIFASLKPAGVFFIDVKGKEALARFFQPTTSEELPDGARLIQRHEIFDDWTRIRNEWIIIRKDMVRTFKFHHTIYSGRELRDCLEQVGFTNVQLYGNLNGDEYGINAGRLIALGRKNAL